MASSLNQKARMKARILAALPYAARDPSLLRYKRVTLPDGRVIKALDIASTAETVEKHFFN